MDGKVRWIQGIDGKKLLKYASLLTVTRLKEIKVQHGMDSVGRRDGKHREGSAFALFVVTLTGRTVTLKAYPSSTIMEVKLLLSHKLGCSPEDLCLGYGGKGLLSDRTVRDYNIGALATLHLTLQLLDGNNHYLQENSKRKSTSWHKFHARIKRLTAAKPRTKVLKLLPKY
jgi:large subunit ribosomal protein L40e